MRIVKWEKLPPEMQTQEVRKYYDILKKKRFSLFLKRAFDIVVSFLMLLLILIGNFMLTMNLVLKKKIGVKLLQ